MTPGAAGSLLAPSISGTKRRAYTSAPSLALKVSTCGSAHLNDRHSAVGVVVTCFAAAPGVFGMRNSSGGRLAYEWTRATVESSGDGLAAVDPVMVVIAVRVPPSIGIE